MRTDGKIVAAVKHVSTQCWDDFWQKLVNEQAARIESTPIDELASLQHSIQQIRRIQQLFVEIKETPLFLAD